MCTTFAVHFRIMIYVSTAYDRGRLAYKIGSGIFHSRPFKTPTDDFRAKADAHRLVAGQKVLVPLPQKMTFFIQ